MVEKNKTLLILTSLSVLLYLPAKLPLGFLKESEYIKWYQSPMVPYTAHIVILFIERIL